MCVDDTRGNTFDLLKPARDATAAGALVEIEHDEFDRFKVEVSEPVPQHEACDDLPEILARDGPDRRIRPRTGRACRPR